MSRTPTYDAVTAEVVTRALHAVAEATPVDRPGTEPGLRLDAFPARGSAERRALGRRRAAAGGAALAAAAALLVGVVLARTGDDGTRSVDTTRPATSSPDGASRIVAQGDPAGLRYTLRWDERVAGMPGSPCLTLVVDGDDDVACGIDDGEVVVGRWRTAAVTEDSALVWGYFGRDVRYVDGSDGTSAETLPIDPTEPDGLRYAVVAVARGGENPVMFDFMAESGELLGFEDLDVTQTSQAKG